MKQIKTFAVITTLMLCIAACTNNNNDTGGMDSSSVSTDPGMGGTTDTGMTSSDSTDIRMPMSDTSTHNAGAATGQGDDTSHHQ
jgi:hypothetical protein